ncbi:RDD family protein [Neptuniibacter sp. 1_MG-2023]|uniref:RDD family protein n=1 Tax=Neptuniibacter sp. 1_MG-2023 TaxID=3062662 RepID=UPI0026E21D2A|nr:RDD family protein [Neptuniibacter sp. 1_MG-2023]MDO6594862.1 RDD family protein [Neptuniibacter sp. 1_MG-2023]
MSRSFKETYSDIKVASPIKRLGAFVYDMILIIALLMVSTGIITMGFNQGESVQGPLFQSFLFILVYLFLSFFWMRNGQTLGMLAWRLRVQTTEGERLNAKQCLLRYIVGILSLLAGGAGFLWMFINKQKMTWHDIASGTHVIELPKRAKILE